MSLGLGILSTIPEKFNVHINDLPNSPVKPLPLGGGCKGAFDFS